MFSDTRAYLLPLGVIRGEAARSAIGAGWALPLGGDDVAFTACEIMLRDGRRSMSEVVRAVEVLGLARTQSPEVGTQVETLLARMAAAPHWPRGVPGPPPAIMGVVNVTPDSFSDGGRFFERDAAVAQGRRLAQEGAAIVDVGGESTRPGATLIPADEEIRRVVPVVQALAAEGVLVSIDTRNATVMEAALAAGAGMINDVSALRHDARSVEVVRSSGVPVVLMHSQGDPATMQRRPQYERALLDVHDHLRERIEAAVAAGVDLAQLIVDPGIGFGKALDHNLDILHHVWLYRSLGVPVLLGVSRKSFITRIAGDMAPHERLPGSLAAALWGTVNGVSILRVHDVAATRQAVQVLCAVMV